MPRSKKHASKWAGKEKVQKKWFVFPHRLLVLSFLQESQQFSGIKAAKKKKKSLRYILFISSQNICFQYNLIDLPGIHNPETHITEALMYLAEMP